ncbi:MAG: InlB B-repeat-containing protein [Clostridia bacterium]|nr:InlB B-repeat-containing protein [Clostridia bacterium]
MKRTKRLLSLLICLLLTVTSLPATQLVAFADDTAETLVSLHETTWNNVSDTGWTLDDVAKAYVTQTLDDNGYYTIKHTKTTGTAKNKIGRGNRTFGNVFVIAEDTDNKTKVVRNKIDGKYTIELDIDLLMKQYEGTSVPYYSLGFMSGETEVLSLRLRSDYMGVLDNSGYKRNTHDTVNNWDYDASTEAENIKVRFDIDTVNKAVSSYLNGKHLTYYEAALVSEDTDAEWKSAAPIDGMSSLILSRADLGTFLTIKELKVTQISAAQDSDANAVLSALPAKLAVADINNVTENAITLPAVDGVTWTSSDNSLVAIDGTNVIFNRVIGEKKAVSVKAAFAVNGTTYEKIYNITLAEGVEDSGTPDVPETPEIPAVPEGLVSYVESKWNNVSELGWNLDATAAAHITPTLDENGYFTFAHTTTTGTGKNKNCRGTRTFGSVFVISEDNDNRTKISRDTIDGKYTIEFDLDLLMKTYTGTSAPYYSFGFTSNGTEILTMRLRGAYFDILDNNADAANSVYNRNTKDMSADWDYAPAKEVDNVKVRIDLDTVNKTVTTYLNGKLLTHLTGTLVSEEADVEWGFAAPINGMKLFATSRADVGSFLKVKEMKVTQVSAAQDSDANAILSALPAKLAVADINNVTENSITLPAVDGVTWTSSDNSLVAINGTNATVNRVKGEKKEVSVKASFTVNGANYEKTYDITLAEGVEETVYHKVTYTVDGSVYHTENVVSGGYATFPANPSKEGYDFKGWTLNGTAYDVSAPVTGDITLVAEFEAVVTPEEPEDPEEPEVTEGLVSYVESKLNNVSELGWTLDKNTSAYVTPTLDDEGHFVFEHTETTGTEKNKTGGGVRAFESIFVIAEDNDNRTQILRNTIDGKYTIDFDFDLLMKTYPGTSAPYYSLGFTSNGTEILSMRLRGAYFDILDNNDDAGNSVYKRNTKDISHLWDYEASKEVENVKVKIDIDTEKRTVSTFLNGKLLTHNVGVLMSEERDVEWGFAAPINGMEFFMTSRADVGSFLKVNEMKVTQISAAQDSDANAVLSALPAKLAVSDVNNVTENTITLPAVGGVTWTSSDDSLVAINGTTATVNRVKGENKEVSVTAEFTVNETLYKKVYNITLAKGENVVTYYDMNGNVAGKADVADGNKASEISGPTEEHYNFIGWYEKDATTAFDFNTAINNHLDLYAKYEPKTYNVIFKIDGNVVATLSGKYGETVNGTLPEIPAKPGYTAIGWYIADTETTFSEATAITGPDMVVNAKYKEGDLTKYTVTYKADGKVFATETVVSGYSALATETPVKDNYTFAYWTLNGSRYNLNKPVTGNITLEAVFSPNPVKVNFYMDEAMTELYQEGTGYYNTAYGTLPAPEKDSYKFVGWKTADGAAFTEATVVTEEISVYATWEYSVKVVLDEDITKYDSMTGNIIEFLPISGLKAKTSMDNGYVVQMDGAVPTDRTMLDAAVIKLKTPLGDYDAVNKTQLYNNRLVGDYEVEVTFQADLTGKYTDADGTEVTTAPYGMITTGRYVSGNVTKLLSNRIGSGAISSFNFGSSSTNSFNAYDTDKVGKSTKYTFKADEDVNVKIRYNTETKEAFMTVNDGPVSWGDPGTALPFIDVFYISLMNCNRDGDYIRIKNVKVTQYNDYSGTDDYKAMMETVAKLPESLVADPNNATGQIVFPFVKGVTWSSSDEATISVNDGIIKPWYEDREVEIIANITSGKYSVSKVYYITVKKDESVNVEEISSTDFVNEESLGNWSFVNLDTIPAGDYKVDENGLKISKTSEAQEADKNHEIGGYVAYYDFYHEVSSDEYSVSEANTLDGVYDITVDLEKYSTSKLPINIAVGNRNGNEFKSFGTLKVNMDGTKFVYQKNSVETEAIEYKVGDSAKITFRVDTNNNEVCLYVDGEIVAYRCVWYEDENSGINSLKVELDKNNNLGDYVVVKNVALSQIVKNDTAETNDILSAANSIDVYDIVSNPDSASGKINVLPEEVNGYKVTWKSSSEQIDIDSRNIYHAASAQKVYVTAEIYDADVKYPVTIRKTFEINVRASMNGTETDEFIINSLGKITNQDYDDIRYDLNLPQVAGITWTSSNTSIITNDGKLVENAVVTTATPVTITAASNNVTKAYNLVVSPRTAQVDIATGTAPLAVTLGNVSNAKISSDVIASFTYNSGNGKVSVVDDKGTVLVSMVAEADGVHFDYLGSDYKKYNLAGSKVEIKVMPDIDKAAIFADGVLVADYVELKNKADYVVKVTSDVNISDLKLTTDKYGVLKANVENYDYFSNVKSGYANASGIVLPTDTLTDAVITWTSSNTSVLSNNGAVTVPNVMTIADVTFKIADKENPAVYIEEVFEVAVDCDSSKNLITGIVPAVDFENFDYPRKNVTDNKKDTIFKAMNVNVSDFDIIFNLGESQAFNAMFVMQKDALIADYEIYSSKDGNEWKSLASGNMSGVASELIRFNNTSAQYVKLVIKKCGTNTIDLAEIKLFFNGTALELAQFDLNALTIDAAPVGNKINLPSKGVNGTEFTWESSDESVISANGSITRPQTAKTVVMTAKVTVDGQTLTKSFDVYVDSKSIGGATQVGGGSGGSGGSGGGGGGGMSSSDASKLPVIGGSEDTPVYAEDADKEDTDKEDTTTPSTSIYSDVKETDWYADAVKTLTEKGIVSGDGTGYFYPTNNVTREQFVKMILEAIEVEVSTGDVSFADVTSGAWYEAYIATAVTNGIVNGIGGGNFGVGTNITRQDMAVLIERVLNFKNIEVEKAEVEPFADAASVADYAQNAVANMKAIGLIKGYDNNYNPKDNLTRAEAATVISSLLELLAK